VVAAGDNFSKTEGYTLGDDEGDTYVFDDTPNIEGTWNPDGGETKFSNKYPDLYNFYIGVICPGGAPTAEITGGTSGSVCSGDGVQITLNLGGTPPYYYQPDFSDLWKEGDKIILSPPPEGGG